MLWISQLNFFFFSFFFNYFTDKFLLLWFFLEPLYMDDLEAILEEGLLTLNTEVDDGSIEEVHIL